MLPPTASTLLDSLAELCRHFKLEFLLPSVLDVTLDLTGADRAFLMLFDVNGVLSLHVARNRQSQDHCGDKFSGSSTVLRKVLENKEPLFIRCLDESGELADAESVVANNLKSVICFPLWKQNGTEAAKELLGVLYIDSSYMINPLEERHLQVMQMLVNHIAISIAHAQLYKQLEEKNRQISVLNEQLRRRVALQEESLHEMELLFKETQRELGRLHGLGSIIGKSKPMLEVFKLLERVVPTDAPLLITGESGTGKELVAKYVHHNGPRRKKPMVSVNCSALSDALLENELFGHHKGAFTGAHDQKVGLFQLADGGSLFLDEVGDMSRDMQKKLLRVLENGEVRPIGSKDVHHVNVRIITATNQDLELLTRQGKFREDLFFRLNVIHVHLPPLRERREDIPILIQHFTCKISEELKRSVGELPTEILQRFLNCDWPGNVRQLANELRRVYILDSKYRPEQMVETLSAPSQENAVTEKLVSMERKVILKALEVTGGNKSRAASLLGIPRRTFYDKLNKYKLP